MRGSTKHPTSPHTCSARRQAPDTWEPSPGLPSSRRGLATLLERAPFAPGPPARKRQSAGARGGRLPAPVSSSNLGRREEGVSFSSNQPPTPGASHNLCLALLPSQTGRPETQRKKKKNYRRSGPILQPRAGRKNKSVHIFPPPPHPDSVIQADPVSKEP